MPDKLTNVVKVIPVSSKALLEGMTPAQVLSELRAYLKWGSAVQGMGRPAAQLWDVLTALRGPDADESTFAKQAVTSLVRRAVLGPDSAYDVPATWGRGDLEGAVEDRLFGIADAEYSDPERVAGMTHHFVAHGKRAFEALGLVWGKFNEFDDFPTYESAGSDDKPVLPIGGGQ